MSAVTNVVATAFGNAQKTVAAHNKCIISLQRERQQSPEQFKNEFIRCMNSMLVVFKREPAVSLHSNSFC